MSYNSIGNHELKFLTTRNILWLDSAYWTFQCDFSEAPIGRRCRSSLFRMKFIDDALFYLEAEKESQSSIAVHFCRVLEKEARPDDGYVLEALISVVGSRMGPMSKYMNYEVDDVFASYTIDYFKSDHNTFTVKCTIRMEELMSLNNERRNEQEKLLKKAVSESEGSSSDMAYLLNRKKVADLFSGRQDDNFARISIVLISRAMKYADRIVELQRMRVDKVPCEEGLKVGLILGFIQSGTLKMIDKKLCASLYVIAHHNGLEFLQKECAAFMLENLDLEYVLDCLLVSHMVNDYYLMNKSLDFFITNRNEIFATEKWNSWKERCWQSALCVLDATVYKVLNCAMQKRNAEQ